MEWIRLEGGGSGGLEWSGVIRWSGLGEWREGGRERWEWSREEGVE